MVEDILYSRAKRWFSEHYPEATTITEYGGHPLCWPGFFGRNDSGTHVAFVSLDRLKEWHDDATATRIGQSPSHSIVGRVGVDAPTRITPLLIVSYTGTLDFEHRMYVNNTLQRTLHGTGWIGIVIDAQTEAKVQAFWTDLPHASSIDIDSIIDMLESLKRVKDGASTPGAGSKV